MEVRYEGANGQKSAESVKIPSTRPDDDLVELSKDGQFAMEAKLAVFF